MNIKEAFEFAIVSIVVGTGLGIAFAGCLSAIVATFLGIMWALS